MAWAALTLDTLIDEYGRDIQVKLQTNVVETVVAGVVKSPENDQWVDGFGAILPLTAKDIQQDTEGAYTSEDRKLYTRYNYQIGNQIKTAEGLEYRIMQRENYSEYDQTNLFIYMLKKEGRLDNSDAGFEYSEI